MTAEQILHRKIFLMRQALMLIRGEIRLMALQLFWMRMRKVGKALIISAHCRGWLSLRTTQRLFKIFKLRSD